MGELCHWLFDDLVWCWYGACSGGYVFGCVLVCGMVLGMKVFKEYFEGDEVIQVCVKCQRWYSSSLRLTHLHSNIKKHCICGERLRYVIKKGD